MLPATRQTTQKWKAKEDWLSTVELQHLRMIDSVSRSVQKAKSEAGAEAPRLDVSATLRMENRRRTMLCMQGCMYNAWRAL